MTIHMIKLCVGVEAVEQLAAYQKQRAEENLALGLPPYTKHMTRNFPKRADQIMAEGGSLYWVIRREIRVRQRFHAIEEAVDAEGKRCCALIFEPELVRVVPRSCRPFQGWRYLEGKDAPQDLSGNAVDETEEMPNEMRRELRALGLI